MTLAHPLLWRYAPARTQVHALIPCYYHPRGTAIVPEQ